MDFNCMNLNLVRLKNDYLMVFMLSNFQTKPSKLYIRMERWFLFTQEEILFSDGKYQELEPDGTKTILHPDGTREIWSEGVKSKIYTTGIIKRVFADGTQETTWPSGQIRVKDAEGHIKKFIPAPMKI
jgi:hypothetical protein